MIQDRARATPEVRAKVMASSPWAGKMEGDAELSSDSDGDSAQSEQGGKRTRKEKTNQTKTKRRRALLQQSSSNDVPLFSHVVHPKVVREFSTEFAAKWVLIGTPESGHSLLGPLADRIPVVAIARNQAHSEILETLTLNNIAEVVLTAGGMFGTPSLADQWSKLVGQISSDDSTEDSDEN